MEPDFSGWATKANLKCSDGRTISQDAFKHMDGQQVPLVWQHMHSSPENVLGYAILKHMKEGVRADAFFNSTPAGQNAKLQVEHGDIKHLSIYANNLIEKAVKNVVHGDIREVSLVLAGANPGAKIDFVNVRHSDGEVTELDDEAFITTGEELFHADMTDPNTDPQPGDSGKTLQDVFNELTPEQQDVVAYIVEEAVKNAEAGGDPDGDGDNDATAQGVVDDATHSDNKPGEGDLSHKEGATQVSRNVFDQTNQSGGVATSQFALSHADTKAFFENSKKLGSLNAALEEHLEQHPEVQEHSLQHGIEPMDILFPNYQNLTNTPTFLSRRMEWVQGVLDGTSKTPFSRVRSIVADITQDEARALGYIKGNLKKEEWFSVSRRTTDPATIYKKQKLDRDDIIDITDFDVVAWMKAEMQVMLKEEIARAVLIGDGRDVSDPDKIKDPMAAASGAGLRSIINEHDLYKTDVNINLTSTPNYLLVREAILRSFRFYKGTGRPTLYTTIPFVNDMLLTKDQMGRYYWDNKDQLANALGVDSIVEVEVMETIPNLFGIIVNLSDYNIGANKGGEVTLFDFFDIDYNQYKYLSETRISGALTRPKSALVLWSVPTADVLVNTIPKPTFNKSTGVVTIPTQTGVVYTNTDTGATLTAGAQTALTSGSTLNVSATPASGYYFENEGVLATEWSFFMPTA